MKKKVNIKNKILFFTITILFSYITCFSNSFSPSSGDIDLKYLKNHTKEEWNLLIDNDLYFDEINDRLEYFSPTFKNYYNNAYNTGYASLLANGVDEITINGFKDTVETLNISILLIRKVYPPDQAEILVAPLLIQKKALNKNISQMIKVNNYLYNMIDNNIQIGYIKNVLAKSMETAYVSYMQLLIYKNMLSKQVELYDRIYKINITNKQIGLSTDYDINNAYANYLTSISTLDQINKQTYSVKKQIILTLGFDLEKVDLINFFEPDIDINYLLSIDKDSDFESAYNSNITYRSYTKSSFKGKGETGLIQLEEMRNYLKEKIKIKIDELYYNIESKHKEYDASIVGMQVYQINFNSYLLKKDNGLLSVSNDLALSLQLINEELNIYVAKYNFIQALSTYKYATLGVIDID
ncbi:MAG: hypothetical protein Q4F88_05530 [Eubacteriales bacterium]|nr:hypothetical protein [Eubacteriales bacterium]